MKEHSFKMCILRLFLLIKPLTYVLSGVWFGEENKLHKTNICLEEIGLHVDISAIHSLVNSIGRTYVFSLEINRHAIRIIIAI